jgi:hypothetical protein
MRHLFTKLRGEVKNFSQYPLRFYIELIPILYESVKASVYLTSLSNH